MNKLKSITLFLIISFNGYSQDYMEKIANQTCDCVDKFSDTTNLEKLYSEIGLCMMGAAEPYRKQLKKDHDIDFNNITDKKVAESLGKIIGLKMASVCPDALLKLSPKERSKKETALTSIGKITQIDREIFVVFSVFDNSGKSLKFYWLQTVESNIDLANNYKTLLESSVKIKYFQKEFFDPKIGEYRNFNIIEKLEKVMN